MKCYPRSQICTRASGFLDAQGIVLDVSMMPQARFTLEIPFRVEKSVPRDLAFFRGYSALYPEAVRRGFFFFFLSFFSLFFFSLSKKGRADGTKESVGIRFRCRALGNIWRNKHLSKSYNVGSISNDWYLIGDISFYLPQFWIFSLWFFYRKYILSKTFFFFE